MKTLTKGEIVTIYEDPITQQKFEGKAKLLKKIPSNRDCEEMENWKVKFISDDFVAERLINIS